MNNSVVIRPVITEKSMGGTHTGKFTFVVAKDANKNEIKKAVEKQFQVHVVAIWTNIVKGKSKRTGKNRRVSKLASWKKAVVQLLKDEKISVFDMSEKK